MNSDNAGLAVRYDHTQRPLRIARGTVTQSFDYAPSGARFRESGTDGEVLFFGKLERRYSPTAQDKLYAASNALITQTGTTRTVQYLLTDRLGSVDAIVYPSGTVAETRGFDAFGKPRTGAWADATPPRLETTANTNHGFTGHEHLNSLELIHMNGRVYDYNLGRFMGVDPLIQFPLNSQSLNPYSYLGNNPLSGTDPTGYACTGSHIDRDDGGSCDEQGVWTTVVNAPQTKGPTSSGQSNNGAQRGQSTLATMQSKFKDLADKLGKALEPVAPGTGGLIQHGDFGTRETFKEGFGLSIADPFVNLYNAQMAPLISLGLLPHAPEIHLEPNQELGAAAFEVGSLALSGGETAGIRGAAAEGRLVQLDRIVVTARRETAVAAKSAAFSEGSFSISNWSGYPEYLPKPAGPFRLLSGTEYDAARNAANQANRAMHQADSSLRGLQLHEIQPVKFGGSPTDPLNKIPLTPQQHSPVTTWWNQLQRDVQGR